MDQELLNSISSYTSKLLRKNFGKGPQSCQTYMENHFVVINIRGFISPMEDVLIRQGQRKEVEKARNFIINYITEELKGMVSVSLRKEVRDTYHDWNFPNNSGVIIFTLEGEDSGQIVEINGDLAALEREIARISKMVQKVPDKITIYSVTPTVILVERNGILITIEQSLIEKGYEEELIITKDELEKKYFHRYGKFEEILRSPVKDIFIDWNLREDRSMMVFILS